MIDVRHMRDRLRDNPQWDTITAYRELSGMEPTPFQREQLAAGGNADPEVKRYMVDQIAVMQRTLWGTFPNFTSPDEDFWRKVDLRPMSQQGDMPTANYWLKALFRTLFRRALERFTWWPVHPVVMLYRELLGRDPDPEGLAFWLDVYDRVNMTGPGFRAAFIRGIQEK